MEAGRNLSARWTGVPGALRARPDDNDAIGNAQVFNEQPWQIG
jgi:hypothetical protein